MAVYACPWTRNLFSSYSSGHCAICLLIATAINDKLAAELLCCICQELMVHAHLLPTCGHLFCELVRDWCYSLQVWMRVLILIIEVRCLHCLYLRFVCEFSRTSSVLTHGSHRSAPSKARPLLIARSAACRSRIWRRFAQLPSTTRSMPWPRRCGSTGQACAHVTRDVDPCPIRALCLFVLRPNAALVRRRTAHAARSDRCRISAETGEGREGCNTGAVAGRAWWTRWSNQR